VLLYQSNIHGFFAKNRVGKTMFKDFWPGMRAALLWSTLWKKTPFSVLERYATPLPDVDVKKSKNPDNLILVGVHVVIIFLIFDHHRHHLLHQFMYYLCLELAMLLP
jgi:hypothetical protein